ncbi:hypothetical protein CDH59_15820 [Escherichia coli]|nr:hypothetical protein CDH59_15820 [Escherichia coli]
MATDADYDTENGFERAKPERSVRSSMCFTAFWRLLFTLNLGNDSNLLIVFYVQIMPDDFVMQLHRF